MPLTNLNSYKHSSQVFVLESMNVDVKNPSISTGNKFYAVTDVKGERFSDQSTCDKCTCVFIVFLRLRQFNIFFLYCAIAVFRVILNLFASSKAARSLAVCVANRSSKLILSLDTILSWSSCKWKPDDCVIGSSCGHNVKNLMIMIKYRILSVFVIDFRFRVLVVLPVPLIVISTAIFSTGVDSSDDLAGLLGDWKINEQKCKGLLQQHTHDIVNKPENVYFPPNVREFAHSCSSYILDFG